MKKLLLMLACVGLAASLPGCCCREKKVRCEKKERCGKRGCGKKVRRTEVETETRSSMKY